MFATILDHRVYVTLSRRNLRELDAILDNPATRNICLTRRDENGVFLVVQVEDDADHYEGRDGGRAAQIGDLSDSRGAGADRSGNRALMDSWR